MKKKFLFAALIFMFTSAVLSAFGGRDKEAPVVQVTGIVRLVGTALFPELVITGNGHVWHVSSDEKDKLMDMQYSTVTVEAVETVTELHFANGQPAGIRRELRNIRIKTGD